MKKYIDFNTEKRKNAANDFEKDVFKLMSNSVYGKTINNEKGFLKYTSRPTYVAHKFFDKDCAAIHKIKSVLVLNKPIYVGFTLLDLSKWNMYDFHYNFI